MTVDGAVDRLVARLAGLGAGGVRVRLTGLDEATLKAAQDAAALLTETLFYIDGEPGAVDGCLLYDLYEELIFPEG